MSGFPFLFFFSFWPLTPNAKELRKAGKERQRRIISQILLFFMWSHTMKKHVPFCISCPTTYKSFFPKSPLLHLSPSFLYALCLLVSISVYLRKLISSYLIRITAVLKSDASDDIMFIHCRSTAHHFFRGVSHEVMA